MLIKLLVLCPLIVWIINADCNIPPDFWCDHVDISRRCGTEIYCSRYHQSSIQLSIAFESLCPDSQQFIVDRLYPNVLDKTNDNHRIDIRLLPWGLATRDVENTVNCHHGEAECRGNRLLSCILSTVSVDYLRYRIVECIMARLKRHQTVDDARDDCYRQNGIDQQLQSNIRRCTESNEVDRLQRDAEIQTHSFTPNKRQFVPWIAINNRSLIEMQAYQMMLAEKLSIWSNNNRQTTRSSMSKCRLPSDFWCDDSTITDECANSNICNQYYDRIFWLPINLTIIYDVNDRKLIKNSLIDQFRRRIWNSDPTMHRMVRIRWIAQCSDQSKCYSMRIHQCVQRIIDDQSMMNDYVACHATQISTINNDDQLFDICANKMNFPIDIKDRILTCARGDEGSRLQTSAIIYRNSLTPELPTSTPWLVINDMSIQRAQMYQSIVNRLICIWYRGPGHDRSSCARCDYEPTHCS